MTLATRGKCSFTWMPGAFDEIGWCGPRICSGASGFMSNMSRWLGPPNWKRKMTDLARALGPFLFSSAHNRRGSVNPSKPSPPTLSKCRRENAVARQPSQPDNQLFVFNIILLSQNKFLRVQQRPGHVLQPLAPVAARFHVARRFRQFPLARRTAQAGPVKFVDHLAAGFARSEQCAEPVVSVRDELVDRRAADKLEGLAHRGVARSFALAREQPRRLAEQPEELFRARRLGFTAADRRAHRQLAGAHPHRITVELRRHRQEFVLRVKQLFGGQTA